MRRVRAHWRWQIQRKLWRREVRAEGGGDGANHCNQRGSLADHKCEGANLSHWRHELWLWKSGRPLMTPLATPQVLLNYEPAQKTHKLLCEIKLRSFFIWFAEWTGPALWAGPAEPSPSRLWMTSVQTSRPTSIAGAGYLQALALTSDNYFISAPPAKTLDICQRCVRKILVTTSRREQRAEQQKP